MHPRLLWRTLPWLITQALFIVYFVRFGHWISAEAELHKRLLQLGKLNSDVATSLFPEPCDTVFYDQKYKITFYDMIRSNPNCKHNQYPCVHVKTARISDYQVCTYDPAEDKPASQQLQETGRWKPQLANQIATALKRDPKLGFLDMGAGLGVFSLLATSLGRKVLAIEPLITNVQRIHRAAKLNRVERLLTIVTSPVFSSHNKKKIGVMPGNMGGAKIDFSNSFKITQNTSVRAIHAEDLLPVLPFKSAVMKVAVNGFEIAALYYASELLEAVHIPVIFIDWQYINEAGELDHLLELLHDHHYKPYVSLTGRPLETEQLKSWSKDIAWVKDKKT